MKLGSRKVYGIRNKKTAEPWETPRGKWAWQGVGQAKNAFLAHNFPHTSSAGYFETEDCEFEVVLLGELRWEPVE